MVSTETIDIVHLNLPNAYQVIENDARWGKKSTYREWSGKFVFMLKL